LPFLFFLFFIPLEFLLHLLLLQQLQRQLLLLQLLQQLVLPLLLLELLQQLVLEQLLRQVQPLVRLPPS
jgi:hypothetical protein